MRPKILLAALVALAATLPLVATAGANPLSGAIFTTLPDGSEVNFNIYDAKEDVYLDGGPGIQAPIDAAGLPDDTYVFQVTDPSGKSLLSTDPAGCRLFETSGGVITSVAPSGACAHVTGLDADWGATTVQLMPYLDTPNNGGVYKVWVEPLADFLDNCGALGSADPLGEVDCGSRAGNLHGFEGRDSKTDNFKVRVDAPRTPPHFEIDVRFFPDDDDDGVKDPGEEFIDGLYADAIDTHGAQNRKFSYFAPELDVYHEAHFEAPETGVHTFVIESQPGCEVHNVYADGALQGHGPYVEVEMRVKSNDVGTKWIDVACVTS